MGLHILHDKGGRNYADLCYTIFNSIYKIPALTGKGHWEARKAPHRMADAGFNL